MIIGVLSDAHGNGLAFCRALSVIDKYDPERLYYLGDAIGYIPSISVLDQLYDLGDRIRCIRGNHEEMILNDSFDLGNDDVYQLSSIKKMLTKDHWDMIGRWEYSHIDRTSGTSILMVHGSPIDPTDGYIYPDTALDEVECDANVVFMGHTHRPFIREENDKLFINVGSCGLPRDCGKLGACAIFDSDTREAKIVRFDIQDCVTSILEDGPPIHASVRKIFEREFHELPGGSV